jgi:hypothetical protein
MNMRTLQSLAVVLTMVGCSQAPDESVDRSSNELTDDGVEARLNLDQRVTRYGKIRDAARVRGIDKTAFLLGGIVYSETGVAHCWSEATWACQGPSSVDCGGGPVIAGSADGPCSDKQGGLGMFQFDAGTYSQTIAKYGSNVVNIDGQIEHAINYVVDMLKRSAYTGPSIDTLEKAKVWFKNFDVNNASQRDIWIKTVTRYYNGCQPSWSCWSQRLSHYEEGLDKVLSDTGGTAFWKAAEDSESTPAE